MKIEVGDVVVITGAASGIGRSLAVQFAERGCNLVLADIETAALDAVVAELAGLAPSITILSRVTDVSLPAELDALAALTLAEFGRVDIVCNNAGVAGGGNTWELSADDWAWVIGVNLVGVVNGVRSFVPHMIERGRGHVINTASVAGLLAAPGMAHYNATKHAVVGLSETLYRELGVLDGELGVTVVCPGWVSTKIYLSDRNRPAEYNGGEVVTEETLEAIEELAGGFFEAAMSPDEVATQVISAVDEDRFWVLTHPEMSPDITARYAHAVTGTNPPVLNPFG